MSGLFAAWFVLCGLITLVWIRRHFEVSRAGRTVSTLSPDRYDAPPDPAPSVSVIVAAKDEEAGIERCVRTLLDQDYPNFTLTVVNDRSDDRTGAILEEMQREAGGRLRVLHVTELPEGWYGKTNAVHTGLQCADGEYLLFTDADCEQTSRRTLTTAVRYAVENGIELLSVLPEMQPGCLWDAVMQPVCAGVLMIWHRPERVNDPNRREAYANGAFMLIRRGAYRRIGGHQAVRASVCEDMQLARNAKAAGVRLHVIHNQGLYVTRMYGSFIETVRGWSRIFVGSLQRPFRVLLALGLLGVFSIVPFVSLAAALIGRATWGAEGSEWWGWAVAVSVAAVVALQSVMFRFYRLLGAGGWRALLFGPGAVVCFGILLHALLRVGGIGSTIWGGTAYRPGARRTPGSASGRVAAEEGATHAG